MGAKVFQSVRGLCVLALGVDSVHCFTAFYPALFSLSADAAALPFFGQLRFPRFLFDGARGRKEESRCLAFRNAFFAR